MKQSRKASAVESTINIVVGFGVQYGMMMVVATAVGVHMTWTQNTYIGIWMTVVSFVRSYSLRRLFEFLRVSGVMP